MITFLRYLSSSSKGRETFKSLASRLAREKEIEAFQGNNKKHLKIRKNSSVTVIQEGVNHRLRINEPLTFSKILERSKILTELKDEDDEDSADQFLDQGAAYLEQQSKPNEIDWTSAMELVKESEMSYHDPKINKAEIMYQPGVQPSHNVASFVNQSKTMQRLVDLGTKISEWEKNDHLNLAYQLDFANDVVPRIHFLIDHGVNANIIGDLFTKNPDLFDQSIEDLNVRINYLTWKNFNKNQIRNIILLSDSKWLNFQVLNIDSRLGFMQKLFNLNPKEVKQLTSTCPQLVIWKGTPTQVENNLMDLKHAMGFKYQEIKDILLRAPNVFMEQDSETIQNRFDVLHNDMGYSHELIAKMPKCLTVDHLEISIRYKFLQKLGRDQFNPKKPNYVNPEHLATSNDVIFCNEIAKVPVQLFNKFQQTI